jgi:hypothetical protein
VHLLTEGTLGRGVNPSGTTVLTRGWARMRSRPLVDEACALSVAYGSFLRCFPAGLRSIGGTPNYGPRQNRRVPWSGAPDCPVCHRTVSGAPGPYICELFTFGFLRHRSAIIHQTIQCATELSGAPAEQRLLRATIACKS